MRRPRFPARKLGLLADVTAELPRLRETELEQLVAYLRAARSERLPLLEAEEWAVVVLPFLRELLTVHEFRPYFASLEGFLTASMESLNDPAARDHLRHCRHAITWMVNRSVADKTNSLSQMVHALEGVGREQEA